MATPFQVTFDCADPDALARFWAAALGYVVQPPPEGYADWETWLTEHGMGDRTGAVSAIVDPDGVGARFYFQRVPEPKTAKNRMHLDLNVSAARRARGQNARALVEAEAERLASLGATRGRTFDEAGEFWIVMADLEGNEFCVQ